VSVRELSLGPAVVQLFVPQRRPFLMVDRILGIAEKPKPTLVACRYLSMTDPVFEGHFPGLAIAPGAHIIEGLAQTAGALRGLLALAAENGMDQALEDLEHVEWAATLNPGCDRARAEAVCSKLRSHSGNRVFLAGHMDAKFLEQVFPGCRLDYHATLLRELDDQAHFELEARVDGRLVTKARGSSAMLRLR